MASASDVAPIRTSSSVPAPQGDGEELVLASAHDSEQLVCARGALFFVTDRRGDIVPAGARELGLFYEDTRYLSHLALSIANVQLVQLSAETSHDAYNQVDLMVSGFDQGDFLDDPQNFLHVRRRQLLEGGLVEEITITSFLNRTINLDLVLQFDADFADIFEARGAKRDKRGSREPPQITQSAITHAYNGLDGIRYSSELSFSPAPSQLNPHEAHFQLEIEAAGTLSIELNVVPQRNARGGWARIPFDQRVRRQLDHMRNFRETSTRVRSNDAVFEHVCEQSVADLYSMRVEVGGASIVSAGIPWFCSPFGRDSLLACYQALLLNPELAVQSLRVLAQYQGKRDNQITEEQPGKIFHELRFGEMANTGEVPHSPYYGSIDATPLFVIVTEATYRVTGDMELLREMRDPLLAALGWIDRQTQEGTRLLSYERTSPRGLDNQGWKDSRNGVSFPDGRLAQAPIALCEAQGYCVDAYARAAQLLQVLGDLSLAETYRARAEALRELTNELLWLPGAGRYAFAIDGRGETLDTVVSNLGHLLWSRVATPERASLTAELLMSASAFSGFGIRTLATNQAVYNPLSYHNGTVWPHDNALVAEGFANYGMTQKAAAVFEGMIHAMAYFRDRRLPELFCGIPRSAGSLVRYPVACSPQAWASAAPFLLLQAALGLHLDAPAKRLRIRNACIPSSMEWVELDGLRVGQTRVALRLRRSGERVHVERLDVSGPALRTEVEFD